MKPLIVLLITFNLALIITKVAFKGADVYVSGRIAMAVMLLFTSIGHFSYTKGMEMMIPTFVPYKKAIVCVTGIIEIVAAIGVMLASTKVVTAWLLIVFFIVLLPANIYAAVKKVDYQKGTLNGPGLKYLWFRVPLQLLFIAWVYFFAIKDRLY